MASEKKTLPPRPAVMDQPSLELSKGESTSTEVTVAHDLLNILESAKSRPGSSGTKSIQAHANPNFAQGATAPSSFRGAPEPTFAKIGTIAAIAILGIYGISSWLKKSPAPIEANSIHVATTVVSPPANAAPQPVAPTLNTKSAISAAPAPANAASALAAVPASHQAANNVAQAQQEAERIARQKEDDLRAQRDREAREADDERERALREPASSAREESSASNVATPAGGAPGEENPVQQPPAATTPAESAVQ